MRSVVTTIGSVVLLIFRLPRSYFLLAPGAGSLVKRQQVDSRFALPRIDNDDSGIHAHTGLSFYRSDVKNACLLSGKVT